MARSKWKPAFFDKYTLKLIFKKINLKKKIYKIFKRNLKISKFNLKKLYKIHKGNTFRKFICYKYTLGKKFGEFSFTRKPFHYPKRFQKKKR